jgi:hypothetical protein
MNTTRTGKGRLGLLLFVTGLLCFTAPKARADEGDPPTRVARISFVDGSVSFQPGGSGDWGSATKNRPMTVGDKIWTDRDSRAELQAGQVAVHLGSTTALSFLNLDQNITQMRLTEGQLNFRVRELREGELYEVDTPNLAFTVRRAGAFRIDVNENGDSTGVTAIRGEGEVTAGGRTYEVHEGERADFNGADNIQYSTGRAPDPDKLDRWAMDRDLKTDHAASARYVSRDVVGYEDLDEYGDWRDEPEYGHVWYPRSVAVGWAPYSVGYWSWVGPWGWTWVDYEPWGFAPFHYGRWAYVGGAWGWCPGPIYAAPVYGPAVVGFIGGRHWGVGFGFGGGWGGGVGWFPLGWGEPYHPWYRSSVSYVNVINVHNTFIRNTNIINTANNHNYAYAHNVNAVTATSHNAFVNGQAINRGAAHLTEASLKGAQVTNGVSATPTRQSYLGAANTGGHVAMPPSAIQNRPVLARTAPAAAASHMPVRTMSTGALNSGRAGTSNPINSAAERPMMGRVATTMAAAQAASRPAGTPNTAAMSTRQRELSQNRPPSAIQNGARMPNSSVPQQGATNGTRTWAAQGNVTDRGQAPQAFGRSNASVNNAVQSARLNQPDRPPWARSSPAGALANSPASREAARSNAPAYNNSRPSYSNGSRSYGPPQRTYRDTPQYNNRGNNRSYSEPRSYNPRTSAPSRSYSPPSRSYSAPPRSYSAPSRSYSAPSRSTSAPSRSSGGSNSRGGGGSAPSRNRH